MFGFPIDHDGSKVTLNKKNHQGAGPEFAPQVEAYLQEEVARGCVLGPFKQPPFPGPVAVSPLNTVAKKDSNSRRVIVDLSFPENFSVNSGIKADEFLGVPDKLRFPSIDDLIKIIHKKGPACLLFKRDLSRAYRQLPADFGCVHLLGYWYNENYFFDLVLPMGLRSSARFMQMVSSAITYIFNNKGFDAVNYIDDFGGAETRDKAWTAFVALGRVISEVGMQEAIDKASPPSHVMTFLGLEVNTLKMTLRIPDAKLQDIRSELVRWESSSHVSRNKFKGF